MLQELSVVIPTYNEKSNIEILIPQLFEVFNRNAIDGEIIIVDDSSTDGTQDVIKEFVQILDCIRPVFRTPPNSLSQSWYEGFNIASKKNIVCIDADLCHDPIYFLPMLNLMETYDIIIGSRYINKGLHVMEGKPFYAILVSIVGQYLTRWTTGIRAKDTSHSFRMFRKDVFQTIKPALTCEGNAFLVEFLYLANRAGYKIGEIPITYGKRLHGATKLKVTKEGLRYLKLIAKLAVRRRFKK